MKIKTLNRSIQQILLAGSAATFAIGALAAVGQQNPPPGPGQIPDYFGVVPNYANSPQPILTKVTVNTGTRVAAGSGASATAILGTGGAIDSITNTNGGSGYVTPQVTITDQGLGNGASVTVTTTATSGGVLTGTYNIVSAGSDCAVYMPVVISGNGTAQVSSVDTNGAVTAIQITNNGSGYTGNVPFSVDCTAGGTIANALNASGSLDVSPGTPGVISGVTVNPGQAGVNYIPNAKVIFTDPNRIAAGNTDAVAHVTTVDANGAITGITVDNPGTGYTATTTATIQDVGTGTGAKATATAKKVGTTSGVISTIKVTAAGTGYRNPLVEITDANAGAAGQGAVLVATTYDYATDQQTDKIMDVQVLNPGSGYDAGTAVNITGGLGSSAATVTPIIVNGSIVGIEGADIPDPNSPTGYIRDPNFVGLNLGSGFKTPIAGSGIKKFVNALPGIPGVSSYSKTATYPNDYPAGDANTLGQALPAAVADTTTFPGSDYYVIAETEYAQKLHTDLPATHLRGYVQLDAAGAPMGANQYLGPIIVAQKDRPVRIKLVNRLSTGADATGLKGKIGVPVDTTYMGADTASATENRAALHLHGGNTPWISDGTPRQWVKPKGEGAGKPSDLPKPTNPNKGESAQDVPDMWFDANGDLLPNVAPTATDAGCQQGTTTCTTAGATNNPGDGALTFFFTNEQSARLMFYHDHAEGITRLNVYAGVAAGYLLQDPTEQALVANGTLPSLPDTIPLVIQEKTFMPDNTKPVLNFYGPFVSQLNSQDPTWRWGTGTPVTGVMGNGDLWVPHVFMPNQNPGDISGANAVGRWDYGAWFWPPFANLQNGPIANPYYDINCLTTTTYCEGPEIPGVPNGSQVAVLSNGVAGGVHDATKGDAITESPSGTPEAFNDTPLVNGTAYPYINVDPKQYRLRILSVGNDRMLNLSLVMAASKNADSTALGNSGPTSTAPAVLCDGTTSVAVADCTEVKMVPFDATQNKTANTPFPPHWYTAQKGGVTFDGRPSGVFDPTTRGPAMVQIGTEGGFLSSPTVIKNQPVNYEYNPKNILIGNIKEHALLLGPAERADVLVDFSNFAGTTLLMYNDAGAPVPAWDLRLDYYTGNFDNTDTGGAFSVIPGYGPNSRTLMQIRVASNCATGVTCAPTSTHPVDDLGSYGDNATGAINPALVTAIQAAFKTSQEPIIVPQAAYNKTYGISATDALGKDLSRITDNQLSYFPLDTTVFPYALVDTTKPINKVTLELEPKTIIEDWTQNWGRMNALLGTEVPHTTAINQTSIPQAYVDPPTDLVKITPNDNMVAISGTLPDGTQLWKVTHNGVDSHAIHFHLFHVQIVNRVGWDGAIYPPAANELGWKDTVLMHPLSDVVVALRPMVMNGLPFKVPNSHRLLDPAKPAGGPSEFFNFNPLDGNASDVINKEVNYGWEYVWHCHILGHEENDMMRAIAVAQPPEAPIVVLAATNVATGVQLNWTDDSIISNWVTIQRSTSSTFATIDATFNVLFKDVYKSNVTGGVTIPNPKECSDQAGCLMQYVDTTVPALTSVYYRIMANNTVGAGDGKLDQPRDVGGFYTKHLSDLPDPGNIQSLTPMFAGYNNVTANSDFAKASRLAIPVAGVSTAALTFNQVINTTSAAQTVTVTNTSDLTATPGNLTISGVALTSGTNYAMTNDCPATLAPKASCTISVTFTPTALGSQTGTLTITDNTGGVAVTPQTVTLSGTGTAPIASVSSASLPRFGDALVGSTSAAQTVTLSNSGTGPLSIASIAPPAQFAIATVAAPAVNCSTATPLAAGSSCVIGVTFKPTVASAAPAGSLIITDNTNGAVGSSQLVALSAGTGVAPLVPAFTSSLSSTPPATVSMSWTASSSVATQPDSYQVQRTAASLNAALNCSTAAFSKLGATTTSLTATDTTMAANRTYCYRVVATNAAGDFTSTPPDKVTTPAAPTAPTNLTITGITSTGLTVGWTASGGTPAPTGYEVQQCLGLAAACGANSAGWTPLGTTAALTYPVTNLNKGSSYFFRIRAYNPVTSAFVTSTVLVYPLAVADTPVPFTANTGASQSINAGNVLTNDLPAGPAASKTVPAASVSVVTHTGGNANVTASGITVTAVPATATVGCTTAGACTLALASPATNTYVTGQVVGGVTLTSTQATALTNAVRQASKRGTYTFTYTEQFANSYGTNLVSDPATVTVIVN